MKKVAGVLSMLIISGLFFLGSCVPTPIPAADASLTLDPSTPTFTATATSCPQTTAVDTATIPPRKTRFLFILIDKSNSYRQYTLTALDITKETLNGLIAPGDKVVIAWIGINSGQREDQFFNRALPLPQGFPTYISPSQLPSPTSIPTFVVEGPTTRQIDIMATNNQIDIQNNQAQKEYQSIQYCGQIAANNTYKDGLSAYSSQEQNIIQGFRDQMKNAIDDEKKQLSVDSETHIIDALYATSREFEIERQIASYDKYQLLIFSDMEETKSDILPVSFANIDVLVAMQYCGEFKDCEIADQKWAGFFSVANSNPPVFLLPSQTDSSTIINILR